MSVISLSKIQNVLPEFVDTRLMPTAPSHVKWMLGGGTFLVLRQADSMISEYLPLMKSIGLVNEYNQLDIDLTRGFLESAFAKEEKIKIFNFSFDKVDAESLINILEKYKDA